MNSQNFEKKKLWFLVIGLIKKIKKKKDYKKYEYRYIIYQQKWQI